LSESVLADRHVELSLLADSVTLNGRRCWQVSLIVAELVMNAVRHAFRARQGGSIVVDLRTYGGMIQCAVMDDGEAASVISPGRGTGILDGLAAELGGMIYRTHTAHGSTVVLRIPVLEAASGLEMPD
jgi:two-component sensor histidine kinase